MTRIAPTPTTPALGEPMTTTYTVTTLKSGEQAENYAPHEYKYVVQVDPWPRWITMAGYKLVARDWAKRIVRTLCHHFRETGDADGRTGMDAHFHPTLQKLEIYADQGEIHVLITEPYTD